MSIMFYDPSFFSFAFWRKRWTEKEKEGKSWSRGMAKKPVWKMKIFFWGWRRKNGEKRRRILGSQPHQNYVFLHLPKYPAQRNSIWTWDYVLITDVFPTRGYFGRRTFTQKLNLQVEVSEAMSKALRTSGQSDNPFSSGLPGSNTYLVVSTRYCVLLLRDIRNDGNYNDGDHNDEEDDYLHK